jgi:hypothetical protein
MLTLVCTRETSVAGPAQSRDDRRASQAGKSVRIARFVYFTGTADRTQCVASPVYRAYASRGLYIPCPQPIEIAVRTRRERRVLVDTERATLYLTKISMIHCSIRLRGHRSRQRLR